MAYYLPVKLLYPLDSDSGYKFSFDPFGEIIDRHKEEFVMLIFLYCCDTDYKDNQGKKLRKNFPVLKQDENVLRCLLPTY